MARKLKQAVKALAIRHVLTRCLILKRRKQPMFFARLEDEGKLDRSSMEEIKQYLTNEHSELMALRFAKEVIEEMKQAGKFGNARVYETMQRSLSAYVKDKDFALRLVSYRWLKKYEAWYLAKGNSINGLSVILRTFRALYNQAIKRKLISRDYYPFDDYSIKSEKTRKRAISQADIEKLKNFEPKTDRQWRAKHYFFISFYLMGASFADIARLQVKSIFQGRIEYRRMKTGRLHSIAITAPLQQLLDLYMKNKQADDFILTIIRSDEPEKQIVQIRDELRRYNKTLKEIGKLCKIEAPLTSYVSRHSYATLAKYKGVPTAVISEALGHSDEKTTQIYLDSFENEVLDEYHKQIIGE